MNLTLTLAASRLVRAPRQLVWRVFAEITDWPSWDPAGGGVMTVRPLGWPVRARATVTRARPGELVAWRVAWWGLVSSQSYTLTNAPAGGMDGTMPGTLVEAREEITGWALLLLQPLYSPGRLSAESERWLKELATRAEALARR